MDAVYTYAGDGADPAQHAIRRVNAQRGTGHGELVVSVTLLLRHCRGQVRRIYVVHGGSMLSAGTYRKLEDAVVQAGLGVDRLVVVPQDDILPRDGPRWCHNSCVIESHLWRLPRLSEAFLYLNDDMFFGRPIDLRRTYWGSDRVPLLDCSVIPAAPENAAQMHSHNAVRIHRQRCGAGASWQLPAGLGPTHFPALMLRAACRLTWQLHREALLRMPPTRDRRHTLNFQLLSYLVALDAGLARIRLFPDLHPWRISTAFVEMEPEGLRHVLKHRPHWVCINGVGVATRQRYAEFARKLLLASPRRIEATVPPKYPAINPSLRRGNYTIEVGGPVVP